MNRVLKIIVFILLIIINPINCIVYAKTEPYTNNIVMNINNTKYVLNNNSIENVKLTDIQKKYENNDFYKLENITKMKTMGFSNEDILKYLYPYLYFKLLKVINNEDIQPENAQVEVIKNTANIRIKNDKNGFILNKSDIFNKIINCLTKNIKEFKVNKEIIKADILYSDLKNNIEKRSEFKTEFKNSVPERKNNIVLALKSLDGCVVQPGEIFSFNDIVGKRSIENGYREAKIISNGKFVQSVGGGVCQVSTTLYNSVLLAGLEIIEVNPHSLRIGYIEPGFDAMVNMGTSDLKFKNNTDKSIVIATCSDNDVCKICLFGKARDVDIIRDYEYEDLAEDMDCDIKGKASAWINIYKDNVFIERKLIREVKYKKPVENKE